MSGKDEHHDHDHPHHHHGSMGFLDNLRSGEHGALERAGMVLRNLARRGRGGRPHGCCGNYGEPGC